MMVRLLYYMGNVLKAIPERLMIRDKKYSEKQSNNKLTLFFGVSNHRFLSDYTGYPSTISGLLHLQV